MKKIFLCEDRAESILAAIYDAWADPTPNDLVSFELTGGEFQFSFTDEKVFVTADYEKAQKVLSAVKKRLGFRTYQCFMGALCASAPDKPNALFQFLRYAFRKNTDVTQELAVPEVMRLFELNRKSRDEAHLLLGFVRFSSLPGGVFLSTVGPVNDVLPLIADHFAERFNTQPFIIYDEKRMKSVVYRPGGAWQLTEGELRLPDINALKKADGYEELWKIFFDTIAIRERTNPLCQRTHLPLHFRGYMTEFSGR